MSAEIIYFSKLRGPYRLLPNFAPTAVEIDGVLWPSTEHYYQAQKFRELVLQDIIKSAPTAWDAAKMGRRYEDKYRKDWAHIKLLVMHCALRAKAKQHSAVAELLRQTGDALLVEESRHDAFWGNGFDGNGHNHLGKLWMVVRDELRGLRPEGEISWPDKILMPTSQVVGPENTRLRDAMIRSFEEGRIGPSVPLLIGTYRRRISKNGVIRIPSAWLYQWAPDLRAIYKKVKINLPPVSANTEWRVSVFPADDQTIVAFEPAELVDKSDQTRGYCEWVPGCYRAQVMAKNGYLKLPQPAISAFGIQWKEVELKGSLTTIRLFRPGEVAERYERWSKYLPSQTDET